MSSLPFAFCGQAGQPEIGNEEHNHSRQTQTRQSRAKPDEGYRLPPGLEEVMLWSSARLAG